jgi:hypothetical protein
MKKLLVTLFLLVSIFAKASNEIWCITDTGYTTLKATITRPTDRYVWDTTGTPAFEIATSVTYANRAVALTEDTGNLGYYYADFPATITAGAYVIRIYDDSDEDGLESTDPSITNFTIDWNGTVEAWNNNTRVTDFGTTSEDTLTLGQLRVDASTIYGGIYVTNDTGSGVQIESSGGYGLNIASAISDGVRLSGETNALNTTDVIKAGSWFGQWVANALDLTNVKKILEADTYVDTTTTPWTLEYREKGTATVIHKKSLYQVTGANVTSSNQPVGRQTHKP